METTYKPTERKLFFRHPLFWTFLIGLSLLSGIVSYIYFPAAIPLVDLKITMNQSEALAQARLLAEKFQLGPTDYHQAAYFNSDAETQNFIELERGGAAAWKAFLKQTDYYPYTWIVRHFKEGDTNEVTITFTPDGKPYGFVETIPETAPGAALSYEEARKHAETFLDAWHIDRTHYKLKDSKHEMRATGRKDYTFVFEKPLENLGEAHYLLTVVVTGDKITTLNHSIDIPEAFTRSFQHVRSFNEVIYYFATIIVYIVYLIIGCLAAILLLLQKNWLLPKQALIAGFCLAFLQLLVQLNQFPFLWFGFNTALSIQLFLFQNFLSMLTSFIIWLIVYTTTFVAAEGLTRRAFGSHMQLWSAWKLHAASSITILGKTVTSYCIVALDMAFIILLYAVGMRYFGWWSPSAALTNPMILATYVPALNVLAQALQAGFWEECLFRAVPIASCYLIGKKIGYPKTMLTLGLLLQPLIFGAAHASYPALPFYVRVLELYLPFFGFGLIYLTFGLIPVIIAHSVFDAILMSLPLFVSDAPGILLQRMLVILGCALPLLVVLFSRLRTGRWLDVPAALYNGAWQPVSADLALEQQDSSVIQGATSFSIKRIASFVILACIAIGIWSHTSLVSLIPSLKVTKTQAIEKAASVVPQTTPWKILPSISAPGEDPTAVNQHVFIWQEFGKDTYKKLLGSYLAVPAWKIRSVQFTGDLAQRAEEYQVYINDSGIEKFQHTLAQTAPGAKIDEHKARTIAYEYIAKNYNLREEDLQEIAAQSQALPNRVDWSFTFTDWPFTFTPSALPDSVHKDLAHISLTIAGDQVTSVEQSVHVPEQWLRSETLRQALRHCFETMRWLAWLLVMLGAALQCALLWKRRQLHMRTIFFWTGLYILGSLVSSLLNFPQTIALFTTAKPLFIQIASYIALQEAQTLLESILFGAILAGAAMNTRIITGIPWYQQLLAGISAGLLWVATMAAINAWVYPSMPWFANLTGAGSYLPSFVFLWQYLVSFLKQTWYLQILVYFAASSRSRALLALVIAVALFTPYDAVATIHQWLFAAAIMTCLLSFLYLLVLRAQPRLAALVCAVPLLFTLTREALAQAFPGSFNACILTACAIIALAFTLAITAHKGK